ncbi:MAG: hypothetical protein WAU01_17535 [Saprospiraceae bacterium]
MKEKHIIEDVLRHKIISLFQYRLFDRLIYQGKQDGIESNAFFNQLVDLQSAIYHLDAHLEAHWKTDPQKLQWHWDNIYHYLTRFGIPLENCPRYVNHIKKYEKHELELRVGKSPLRLDMEYFYFYKSCDVKLLRRLIYENMPINPSFGKLTDWRYYDLVTEVNDDVEDVFEDLLCINGNRFLLTLLKHGKQETASRFQHFLDQVRAKALTKSHAPGVTLSEEITETTLTRISETAELMHQRLDVLTMDDLQSSLLLNHMAQIQFQK